MSTLKTPCLPSHLVIRTTGFSDAPREGLSACPSHVIWLSGHSGTAHRRRRTRAFRCLLPALTRYSVHEPRAKPPRFVASTNGTRVAGSRAGTPASVMTRRSGVDSATLEEMARTVGDDVTALVVTTFLASCDARTAALCDAADQGGRSLRDAAHALTAASATVGALRLADLCWEVESQALAGDDAAARGAAHEAAAEMRVVVAALTSSPWSGAI
jgi:HPt (histidine-containing phosphotransfer) domain-containing protein